LPSGSVGGPTLRPGLAARRPTLLGFLTVGGPTRRPGPEAGGPSLLPGSVVGGCAFRHAVGRRFFFRGRR